MKRFACFSGLVPVALLFSAVGCGPPAPEWELTSGTVSYQGKPVADAEVAFFSTTSSFTRIAQTDAEGKFECRTHKGKGLPIDSYEVVVRPIWIDPVLKGNYDPTNPMPPQNRSDIPEKYQDRKTTQLKLTVVAGENAMDIALKD